MLLSCLVAMNSLLILLHIRMCKFPHGLKGAFSERVHEKTLPVVLCSFTLIRHHQHVYSEQSHVLKCPFAHKYKRSDPAITLIICQKPLDPVPSLSHTTIVINTNQG